MSAPIPQRWHEWYAANYPERLVTLPVLKEAIEEIAALEAQVRQLEEALKAAELECCDGQCGAPDVIRAALAAEGGSMSAPIPNYDVEAISAKVHEKWMETKLANGVKSRKSESGEELMVPYDQLSETAKDLDRGSVKTVLDAIAALSC